jgi:Bacterial Ig-like domain
VWLVPIVTSESRDKLDQKVEVLKKMETDRTSRHPIRSTMLLAAIAAALATIAFVLTSSGNSAVAASPLVNGNFETGNLSGWTVTASGGTASAVASYDYCHPDYVGEGCLELTLVSIPPQEGSYFALLTTGGNMSEATRISQPFEASNGDKVSGWAFFKSDNYASPGEKGQVVITSASGPTVATPFEQSVSSVGYSGYSGWRYWEYTFSGLTGTGKFQIEARVQNDPTGSFACWCSNLGLDDVKMSTNGPDTTKPATSTTRSVEPNAAGWNKENVTVKLNATDNEGGWGVEKITYSASGAQTIAKTDASGDSVDVKLDQEGTTTLTYYATDKAGNVEDQKTLTVKIDKTAPWVKSTIPANNGKLSLKDPKISATFLESGAGIDPNTLRIDTFKVVKVTRSGDMTVPGQISYASETVTFTPSITLANGKYRATITTGVEDKADNALAQDYTWSFRK